MSTTPTPRSESKEMPSHDAARLVLAAHPQRLVDALDSRLSAAVVGRLQSCPRLHGRIAPLLIQRKPVARTIRSADDATILARTGKRHSSVSSRPI